MNHVLLSVLREIPNPSSRSLLQDWYLLTFGSRENLPILCYTGIMDLLMRGWVQTRFIGSYEQTSNEGVDRDGR